MLIIIYMIKTGTENSLEIDQGLNQRGFEGFEISSGIDPETIILFGIGLVLFYIIAKIISNIRISGS